MIVQERWLFLRVPKFVFDWCCFFVKPSADYFHGSWINKVVINLKVNPSVKFASIDQITSREGSKGLKELKTKFSISFYLADIFRWSQRVSKFPWPLFNAFLWLLGKFRKRLEIKFQPYSPILILSNLVQILLSTKICNYTTTQYITMKEVT